MHYRARGLVPILLLDARTRDNSRAIAARHGVRVVDIASFQFAEGLARLTRDLAPTPWALFLNDDEVPSDPLLERLAGPPPPAAAQSVAIPRRWAWYEPGKPLLYGRSAHWPDRAADAGADHHWSLFRPRDVNFISAMHTDGFLIDTWCRLSPEEYVIHFEWVLRTRAQRAAKIARYDRYRHGYGSFFANMYLPEDQAPGFIDYRPFSTNAYDRLAQAYFAARTSGPSPILEKCRAFLSMRRNDVAPDDRADLAPKPEKEVFLF